MALSPSTSRGGASGLGALLYDYTVSGSAKTSIDTAVDGSGAGALSGSYTLLNIWLLARTDEAAALSILNVNFNNDTGANYYRYRGGGVGSTSVAADAASAQAYIDTTSVGTSGTANSFSVMQCAIPFYAATTALKLGTATEQVIPDTTNTNYRTRVIAMQWRNTAAITRVAVTPNTGGRSLIVGSRLMIYGI